MRRLISRLNIIHIIFLALLLRVTWLLYAKPIPVSDFAGYRQLAADLITYHQLGYPTPTAYRLPGYPVFLALFSLINPSNLWLSIINILLSVLLVYLIFILAIQLTRSHTIAIIASFIAAIYPIFVFFSPILASEHLFTVVLYSGLVLLLLNTSGKRLYLTRFLAGILFGVAMITRGEAAYYIPIIILLSLLPNEKKAEDEEKKALSHRIISVFLLFIAWGVIVTPWYIRNQIVVGPGSGLSTSGGLVFYYGHHDKNQNWEDLLAVENLGSEEIIRSANAYQNGLNYIKQTPIVPQLRDISIEAIKLFAPKAYPVIWSVALSVSADRTIQEKYLPGRGIFSFLTNSGYLIVGALAFLSLFFVKYYPLRLWITTLGFALMNLLGYAILFSATPRYRYTIEGFLCILAAVTILQFYRYLIRWKAANEIDASQ